MEESEAQYVYRLVQSLEWLRGLKREIKEKFSGIYSQSTDEEIMELYLFLVKSGYCGNLKEAIINTQKQIDNDIENVEKKLKEL
jgi:hypothetical protein